MDKDRGFYNLDIKPCPFFFHLPFDTSFGLLSVRGKIKNSLLLCLWCMFKVEAQRTESWATVRNPKDLRNGQFSGVERRPLSPAPSFLERTLSARYCERIEGCGKTVVEKKFLPFFCLDISINSIQVQKKQKIKARIYPCFGNL